MRVGTVTQQPNERKWYSIDYREALDDGDAITAVLGTTVTPSGLAVSPTLPDEFRVRLFLQGGVDGTTYKITVQVETAGGEVFEDELVCRVKEV